MLASGFCKTVLVVARRRFLERPQVARYRLRRQSQAAWLCPLQLLPAFIAARDDRSAHQAPIWNAVRARFAEAHAANTTWPMSAASRQASHRLTFCCRRQPADQLLPRHRALPLTLMRLFGNKKLRLHSSVPYPRLKTPLDSCLLFCFPPLTLPCMSLSTLFGVSCRDNIFSTSRTRL